MSAALVSAIFRERAHYRVHCQAITMTTKYGVFSEPDYLGPGGVYNKNTADAGADNVDTESPATYPAFKFTAQRKGKVPGAS